MKLKSLILIMQNLIFSYGFANSLNDPQDILSKTDLFLGHRPFVEAFQKQDTIIYNFSDCMASLPCDKPIITKTQVEIISQEEVAINSYGTDKKLKSKDKMSLAQWESINGNYLRARINKIQSFGYQITMDSLDSITCPKLILQEASGDCLKVKLHGLNSMQNQTDYEFILWNSNLGIAQILFYTQRDLSPFQRLITFQIQQIDRGH